MNAIPYNASLAEIATILEREGAPAFERLDALKQREVIDALSTADDGEAFESLAELAGEALEAFADSLADSLQACEERATAYMESNDYLDDYWECFKSELDDDTTRERLATLMDEELTPEEYEYLSLEIAAGQHDGEAPGKGEGPYGVAYDIWARDDALITLGPGGDWQAFPVDDATEQKLGELLDLFNKLGELADTPKADFFDLFSVTLRDGSEYGLDAFAIMVDEPEQILFYVDLESLADSLAEYRKAREEETRERLEEQKQDDEKALANWSQGWREFLMAYREALAWSTNDTYNGEELESLEAFEFGAQGYEQTRADCLEFIRRGAYSLEDVVNAYGYDWAQAGHDFWMTRAGHGVGYWDRDELSCHERQVEFLCNLCDEFGEQWPYIGEDGNGDACIFVR